MHRFHDTLTEVQSRINEAAKQSQRIAEDITLLGVSKTQTAEKIREAVEAGVNHIGENYLQEALDKKTQLSDLNICWHFIGPIQSNKTRTISEHFSWVHSVDRLKIAQRLNDQRPENMAPLNICMQINIDEEESKAGVLPQDALLLARSIIQLPRLSLRGLMVIPKPRAEVNDQRQVFKHARTLRDTLNHELATKMDTLSMGMSADLNAAIAEGATIVRIGTALFGSRA